MEAAAPARSIDTRSVDLAEHEAGIFRLSRQLLGGSRHVRRAVASKSDVHAAILGGLPYAALIHLVSHLKSLPEEDVANALGISTRTLRRQKETPTNPMPADLASKTWMFAETLAKASEVFGGQEAAEHWMVKPAMGLDGQRPIDLLQTLQGAELVNDFLGRLEYGVYS